ncbi:MAG: hypothetical protein LBM04_01965 [Opitutaceae bacterium]|nr:hypothetical protein [Opitutaceae bacterium]
MPHFISNALLQNSKSTRQKSVACPVGFLLMMAAPDRSLLINIPLGNVMKNKLYLIFILCFIVGFAFGCKKSNDTYSEAPIVFEAGGDPSSEAPLRLLEKIKISPIDAKCSKKQLLDISTSLRQILILEYESGNNSPKISINCDMFIFLNNSLGDYPGWFMIDMQRVKFGSVDLSAIVACVDAICLEPPSNLK